ncbi:GIY-YIG nuclease family protein [Vibrio cholerae]|nr:GIY-YIG nuclease family protein [Vibrio cholerae]ELE5868414.1 GIY-YIG nuclease family protein [Vibrio cholerae]ELG7084403.1 GIY-YIG nuclease family protein [Vibrio cholerae]
MSEITIKNHTLSGVKVITEQNWDGEILLMSREVFLKHKQSNILDIVGVYVIYSDHFHKEKYGNSIYIGQGDDVRPRLENHAKDKPYWNKVMIFSSPRLNVAFTFNIEKEFIKLARFANRYKVENGDLGQAKKLGSDDAAYYENFVAKSKEVLSMANVDVFDFNSDGLFFYSERSCRAQIKLDDSGKFILCKGSTFINFRQVDDKARELGIDAKIQFSEHQLIIIEDIELVVEPSDISLFTGIVYSKFENSCGVSVRDILREQG